MPELSDDMYCSQQIVVPPMFPYLLRQYAKAAIRSQPSDLLRWSTAYFRCLSLNLPPPIKPRLEYPVPKDYDGITPGWLRALLYQLQNNTHVDFKLLWDRWIGACLQHNTIIKILCLGGFTDPMAVPLFRFVALCVGFVCENLTQTMIVICEVLTEEPEGGSAMISVETFIDLYTFLANIDASHEQWILNRCFLDELLDLLEKEAEKAPPPKPPTPPASEKEESVAAESVEEEEKVELVTGDVISCPDLDDNLPDVATPEETVLEETKSTSTIISDELRRRRESGSKEMIDEIVAPGEEEEEGEEEERSLAIREEEVEGEEEEEVHSELMLIEEARQAVAADSVASAEKEVDLEVAAYLTSIEPDGEEGSVEMEVAVEIEQSVSEETVEEEEASLVDSKFGLEEVYVERILGIGGIVPAELVNAVCEYMKKTAALQHGMVMPRNIRHYTCPPLEVLD